MATARPLPKTSTVLIYEMEGSKLMPMMMKGDYSPYPFESSSYTRPRLRPLRTPGQWVEATARPSSEATPVTLNEMNDSSVTSMTASRHSPTRTLESSIG
jgi:hypothetical protein